MSGPASAKPDLESEWRRDVARFPAPDELKAEIFADLAARHAEPHRRYHGQSHLSALIALMTAHAPHIQPGSPARLAIWWHDAIYDPAKQDNEEMSARLAALNLVRLQAPQDVVAAVAAIIRATINHWAGPSLGDADYFLDADIAILGAPPEIYDAYTAGVRQEYSWASDDVFRAGRSKFLAAAVFKSRLFRTIAFENAFTDQARANMNRELASLA